jgi:hypothetical protein
MTEKLLCNAIVQFLNYQDCKVWRVNSGMMPATYTSKRTGLTSKRLVRMAKTGTSDIVGVAPDGIFVAIEVKKPETRNRVTEFQSMFLDDIRRHGGRAGVATTPEEALKIALGDNL